MGTLLWPTTQDAASGTWDSGGVADIDEQIIPTVGSPDATFLESAYSDDNQEYIVDGWAIQGGGSLSDSYTSITTIKAWVYGRRSGTPDPVALRVKVNGTWTSSYDLTMTTSNAWHSYEWAGSWSNAHVEAADFGMGLGEDADAYYVGVACLEVAGPAVAAPNNYGIVTGASAWGGFKKSFWRGGFVQ